jgi:hypothetical protein
MKFSTAIKSLSATIALLFVGMPAYGASISLVPSGAQLDSDSIRDRFTNIGDTISFDFQLDTIGLDANLTSFRFRVVRDVPELDLIALDNTASQVEFPNLEIISIDLSNPVAEVRDGFLSGPIGVAPNTVLDLFTTTYNVGEDLKNDGLSDLKILEAVSAIDANGTDVTSAFEVGPGVDVQPQPVPEPSTIFGLGMALSIVAFSNKLKKTKS